MTLEEKMQKKARAVFLLAAFIALGASASENLVAVPEAKLPEAKVIMGRDYWTFLRGLWFADPSVALQGKLNNPTLKELPLFRDCALVHVGCMPPPKDKAAWPTVKENFHPQNPWWKALEACSKPDKPLLVLLGSKHSLNALSGKIDLDMADYAAWKKRHPNIIGFRSIDEWDSKINSLSWRSLSPEVKEEWLPVPKNRYERLDFAKRFFDRQVALHYGDHDLTVALRASVGLDHIAAAWGAKIVIIETTNTSSPPLEYRWQIMSMFCRGAARQFNIPWGWYTANYYNGYNASGEWVDNSTRISYGKTVPGVSGATCGISGSLYNRGNYLAFLSGANFLEPENWDASLLQINPQSNLVELSQWGKDFAALHEFTRENPERGTAFTPVAILTPFAQAYPAYGGKPWASTDEYLPGDYMTDAIFFTIVPGFDRASAMKKGIEGNLHNTTYPMMYDVLVPDSPQPKADFIKALSAYPIAVLTGDYQPESNLESTLGMYVKNGGTLLLNSAYLPKFFKSEFTGVKASGKIFDCDKTALDNTGRQIIVDADYKVAELVLDGAKTLLRDGQNRILATVFSYGKGRVVTTAPLWLTPAMTPSSLPDVLTGKQKFVFVDYFLKRLQKELFPFEVDGDILYGANKTKDGWILWLMNNKGITKFTDTPEMVDPAKQAKVSINLQSADIAMAVELRSRKNIPVENRRMNIKVDSGDLAIIKITTAKH